MSRDYTIAAICAPLGVAALELAVMRTGVLRSRRFWLTIAIVFAFQVLVDGWLTKVSAPIVLYRAQAISGVRWPWGIPVEDYGFSFAMITLALMLWERARKRWPSPAARPPAEMP